jgi:AcrR family transcriptional regulator
MDRDPGRRGRPPKITRGAVAEAVLAIGIGDATIENVAERLGVSRPGLYHHVSGRADLQRIGTEHVLASSALPDPTGVGWADWLRAVGRSIRELLAVQPELLDHYASGAVPVAVNSLRIELALRVLADAGFTLVGALDAFHTIGQLAIGAATEDLREASYGRNGQPSPSQLRAALVDDPGAFPNLRALQRELGSRAKDRFEHRLEVCIAGIAAINGVPK